MAQPVAVGGHGQHHEDALDLRVRTEAAVSQELSYLRELDGEVEGGGARARAGVGRPLSA